MSRQRLTERMRVWAAVLMVALFAAYYAGSTVFVHTHATVHGLITHSHPYDGGAHHTHSDAQVQTIQLLNSIITDEGSSTEWTAQAPQLLAVLGTGEASMCTHEGVRVHDTRGSPATH